MPSLRDPFAHATVAQHFQAYEGKPLIIPAEAASLKLEYLKWSGGIVREDLSHPLLRITAISG